MDNGTRQDRVVFAWCVDVMLSRAYLPLVFGLRLLRLRFTLSLLSKHYRPASSLLIVHVNNRSFVGFLSTIMDATRLTRKHRGLWSVYLPPAASIGGERRHMDQLNHATLYLSTPEKDFLVTSGPQDGLPCLFVFDGAPSCPTKSIKHHRSFEMHASRMSGFFPAQLYSLV